MKKPKYLYRIVSTIIEEKMRHVPQTKKRSLFSDWEEISRNGILIGGFFGHEDKFFAEKIIQRHKSLNANHPVKITKY